jgi:hypothetical protein
LNISGNLRLSNCGFFPEQLRSLRIAVLPKADVPMIYGLSLSYDVGELSGLENAKIYDLLLSAAGDGCFYATQYPRDKTL